MAKHWKMIDGVMKYVDDGQDTQQTQPVQQQTPVQNANNAEKIANDSAVNNAVQNTPVATNIPNQDNTSIAVGQPQQTVAPKVEQPATLTPLQQAQKAYDDAVAKQQEVNNAQIKSYQDIIDRYGAPETAEQAQAREAKDRRKRNLLGLIQLGSNIGNMINATTGGHMGERSVEQPNLVGAYDQARNTELTHRMKRDEKRNAARQAMINLQAQAANGELNRSYQTLAQNIKGEQLAQAQKAKADLEKFKATTTAAEKEKDRALKAKMADDANKIAWARHNETKAYHKALEEARKEANEIKKEVIRTKNSGGQSTVIPVSVKGDTHVYKIPEKVLNNPITVGVLKSYMPKEYQDKIYPGMDSKEIQTLIGQFSQDAEAHKELKADFEDFKARLKEYELGVNAEDAHDLLTDMEEEEGSGDLGDLFADMDE